MSKEMFLPIPLGECEEKNQSVFRLRTDSQSDQRWLESECGSWSSEGAKTLIDESGKRFVVMPEEQATRIDIALRALQEEAFRLKLEKAIFQQMPLDFEDVWAVALSQLQQLRKQNPGQNLNIDEILDVIKTIKKKHSNLFFDVNDIIQNKQPS